MLKTRLNAGWTRECSSPRPKTSQIFTHVRTGLLYFPVHTPGPLTGPQSRALCCCGAPEALGPWINILGLPPPMDLGALGRSQGPKMSQISLTCGRVCFTFWSTPKTRKPDRKSETSSRHSWIQEPARSNPDPLQARLNF